MLLKSHGSLVWLEELVCKTFFFFGYLESSSLKFDADFVEGTNRHTFEDAESSVTSLQSLFIRAYSTSVMCGVLPIIIPLLIVKSRYTSLLFIHFFGSVNVKLC